MLKPYNFSLPSQVSEDYFFLGSISCSTCTFCSWRCDLLKPISNFITHLLSFDMKTLRFGKLLRSLKNPLRYANAISPFKLGVGGGENKGSYFNASHSKRLAVYGAGNKNSNDSKSFGRVSGVCQFHPPNFISDARIAAWKILLKEFPVWYVPAKSI